MTHKYLFRKGYGSVILNDIDYVSLKISTPLLLFFASQYLTFNVLACRYILWSSLRNGKFLLI